MDRLTSEDLGRMRALGLLQHAELNRALYIQAARAALDMVTSSLELLNTIDDRIDITALLIRKTDQDFWGVHSQIVDKIAADEMARLLAKTVVGHEAEKIENE